MAENLFNTAHKSTNEPYREGYERTFGKKDQPEPEGPAEEQDGD